MEIQRAWATLKLMPSGGEMRMLRGIASTPTVDRSFDVVEPKGAQFKLPMPFLWQHDAHEPIGHVTEAKVTDAGIEIVAEGVHGVTDEIDKAWKKIKAGLVRGLSVRLRPIETKSLPRGGIHWKVWELLEVSAVTIPDNAEATIAVVKSFDSAPMGAKAVPIPPLARSSAHYAVPLDISL